MLHKYWKYLLLFVPLVLLYTLYYYKIHIVTPPPDIATFEECVAAGYPVMEIYPEQCRVPGGVTFTRVTTDASPTPITLSGTYTCLPKVNTGAPVTLECALGLKTESGYYARDLAGIPSVDYPALTGNEHITVEGALVPIEMVSADRWQTYDVVGIIAVDKITKD